MENCNYVHVEGSTNEQPTLQFLTVTTKGWECPKCGHCWAPLVQGCFECNKAEVGFPTGPQPGDPVTVMSSVNSVLLD